MPRAARVAPGGVVFHCMNRGNDRSEVFSDDGDYAAFEKAMGEVLAEVPVRLLAYCLMPNHWHLLLLATKDGQLGRFMQRLTVTHVRRWHEHRHSTGRGHVYQGTYKSFPVQEDAHFLKAARYVERNALRAQPGGAGAGLAVVQPVAAGAGHGGGEGAARGVAGPAAGGLAGAGEPAADGGGGRGVAAEPEPGPAVRRERRGSEGRPHGWGWRRPSARAAGRRSRRTQARGPGIGNETYPCATRGVQPAGGRPARGIDGTPR